MRAEVTAFPSMGPPKIQNEAAIFATSFPATITLTSSDWYTLPVYLAGASNLAAKHHLGRGETLSVQESPGADQKCFWGQTPASCVTVFSKASCSCI